MVTDESGEPRRAKAGDRTGAARRAGIRAASPVRGASLGQEGANGKEESTFGPPVGVE